MRTLWGKRLEPFPLHHPFSRRSSQVSKSEKVIQNNDHDTPNNLFSCSSEEKKQEKLEEEELGEHNGIEEAASHHILTSSCDSEGAIIVSEDNSEEEFFSIGRERLFSLSSISIASDELRCSSINEEKCVEHDSESETSSSSRTPSTSDHEANNCEEKPDFQLRSFLRKLTRGPTRSFHPTFPSLPSLRASARRLSRRRSANVTTQTSPIIPPTTPPQVDPYYFYCFQSSWKNFTLSELEVATDSFSWGNLIAEGGNSSVYKGTLDYGQLVAIKKLRGSQEETTADYLSELGILVHVNHPNIANVIGYGVEGGMHLILPLSPYGSLDSMLRGQKEQLTWSFRYKIAVGAALGLSYLHQGCQRKIIHRDIKAANILLTEDFEAQICDFGLAKWLPDKWTHLTVTQYEGTFGYLPPEYFLHGIVDDKTDVYSYGVVLLEIITGRPAIDDSHNSVVMWAKPLLINKDIEELVDPSLLNIYDSEEMNRMIMVSSLCIHQTPSERPPMSKVATMLQGDKGILQSKRKFRRIPPVLRRSSHLDDQNGRVKSFNI